MCIGSNLAQALLKCSDINELQVTPHHLLEFRDRTKGYWFLFPLVPETLNAEEREKEAGAEMRHMPERFRNSFLLFLHM